MSNMILLLGEQTQRTKKRRQAAEVEKLLQTMSLCEMLFHKALFEDSTNSYDEIYRHYLTEWQRGAKYCAQVYKTKYAIVNPIYFEQMYKPIENGKSNA
jgi:hypothetical protein